MRRSRRRLYVVRAQSKLVGAAEMLCQLELSGEPIWTAAAPSCAGRRRTSLDASLVASAARQETNRKPDRAPVGELALIRYDDRSRPNEECKAAGAGVPRASREACPAGGAHSRRDDDGRRHGRRDHGRDARSPAPSRCRRLELNGSERRSASPSSSSSSPASARASAAPPGAAASPRVFLLWSAT